MKLVFSTEDRFFKCDVFVHLPVCSFVFSLQLKVLRFTTALLTPGKTCKHLTPSSGTFGV